MMAAGGAGGLRAMIALGTVILLSQFGFYVAIYVFLRTHVPIWRYMVYALPVFVLGVWGPLWSMRTALAHRWSLVPVQLGMFGAAVASALIGLIFIQGQLPSRLGWLGLLLVVIGVVVSSLH